MNYLCTLRFVGTAYHGSQIQANAHTIQAQFQQSLAEVVGESPDVKCCSRTDSGVHANRYCISFHSGCGMDPRSFVIALNTKLPHDIRAIECRIVPEDFHARYDALRKRYLYRVWNERIMDPFLYGRAMQFIPPIDADALHETAQVFVGTHDFAAMCGAKSKVESTVRTVYDFSVSRKGSEVQFTVSADGFLYHMVRIMVGTLLNAARGKLDKGSILKILESGQRVNLCATAPAEGLYLDEVIYPE